MNALEFTIFAFEQLLMLRVASLDFLAKYGHLQLIICIHIGGFTMKESLPFELNMDYIL